ncbi:threonine--tRNA ligase [Amycolatopsis anabasis]|uniref:threonine--tRNA ligase n=1 Tax=Amycolatopsis anabasis TaxID=1840409 RepID=UPI00131B0697|nr:threonine--tRNA ligase [Amycolatopsis anabasis]
MNDHRKLGRELELFGSDPLIGAGLPYWLPAGAAVRHAIERYVREAERLAGYQHVYSPVLGKRELFELSGHWAHYREDMFPPMPMGGDELVLRPSLCPHHALIFRSRQHSHRELPVRIAELGAMFRDEPSGVLGGLTRVRSIQLNDAHVFCRPDQVAGEVAAVLDLIERAYADLGIRAHRYRLSLRGDGAKYVDDPAMWDLGERALAEVLAERGLAYDSEPGEGAFYGPKIDVQILDPSGRESTLSTVQLDFFQPARFDLHYIAEDQGRRPPVMVHRSIIGSLERLVAHLIEVHAGAFPAWLAPVQAVVLPVADEQLPAAESLVRRLLAAGLRAELAPADRGTLGARVRDHRLVPYQLVLGEREAARETVSVRPRDGGRLGPIPVSEALDRIVADAVR